MQGQDALKQAPAALDAYREAHAREMAALTDDDQRQMLQGLTERRLASFSAQIEHHSAAQRQRWYDTAGEARIAQMQRDASLHWSDDALLRRALGTTRAELRDKAERHKWDSALTESALRQQTSRILVSAIEAAVERDPERARSLRTRYDKHIDATDRVALDARLTEVQTRQRARQASAEILNTTPPDGQASTLQRQSQQAGAIADPEVRTATLRILRAASAAAEAGARALAEEVLARVIRDGLTDPSQISVREWVTLDARHRKAIETRIDHNVAGTEPAPNPALVDELATQMTEAPSAFARRDLVPSIAHHPLPQWQRFHDLQAGIRRKDPATEDEVYAIKRGLQLANKMLPADTPDDVATNYRAELVEEIDTWHRLNSKSPDDAEIRAMLERQLQTDSAYNLAFPLNPETDPPIHHIKWTHALPKGADKEAVAFFLLILSLMQGIVIHQKGSQRLPSPSQDRAYPPPAPPPAGGLPSEKWTAAPDATEVQRHPEPAEPALPLPRITPASPPRPLPGVEPHKPLPPLPGFPPVPAEPQLHKGPEIGAPQLPTRLENIPQVEPRPLIITSDNPSEDFKYFDLERWEWHHHFPRQWWKPNGPDRIPFGPGAMKFFDKQLVLVPKGQHWGTLHSKYHEAIGEALKIYLAGKSQADIENMDEA